MQLHRVTRCNWAAAAAGAQPRWSQTENSERAQTLFYLLNYSRCVTLIEQLMRNMWWVGRQQLLVCVPPRRKLHSTPLISREAGGGGGVRRRCLVLRKCHRHPPTDNGRTHSGYCYCYCFHPCPPPCCASWPFNLYKKELLGVGSCRFNLIK